MPHTLHLVRHGEVHNPDHVVYADLPGFGLSTTGRQQALAAAAHLASLGADVVVSSPLQRALETAAPIAAALGVEVAVDERLTEWALSARWAGVPWLDLPQRFPGELEAYSSTPDEIDFAAETISEVAERMAAVVADLEADTAVLVSHQDPVQALRLRLRGLDLAALNRDKPGHAAVITLRHTDDGWTEEADWAPAPPSAPFPPVVDRGAPGRRSEHRNHSADS